MPFELLESGLAVVLQILEGLHALSQVLAEGQQELVVLVEGLNRVLDVVAHSALDLGQLLVPPLPALPARLAAHHLRHELVDQLLLLLLHQVGRAQWVNPAPLAPLSPLASYWRTHQVLVALRLL